MRANIIMTILLFVAFSMNSIAQKGFFTKNDNIKQWYRSQAPKKNVEINKSTQLPEFQEVLKTENVTIAQISIEDFHLIDFDQNGIIDLLFDGKIGNSNYVFIFLNSGSGQYSTVLSTKGHIYNANTPTDFNNLNIHIWHEACCANNTCINTQYICKNERHIAYFNTANKALIDKKTTLPFQKISQPIAFHTVGAATLRSTPILENEDNLFAWKTNSLGTYPAKSRGVIYAETRDAKGDFWYFVRMDNEANIYIHNDKFAHDNEVESPLDYYYYGWIRHKDIVFIKK